MKNNNWLFDIYNNMSSYDLSHGYNSANEFKSKVVYIAMLGQMKNNETCLSYDEISELTFKYSARTIQLSRQATKRIVDRLVDMKLIEKQSQDNGRKTKNIYKVGKSA